MSRVRTMDDEGSGVLKSEKLWKRGLWPKPSRTRTRAGQCCWSPPCGKRRALWVSGNEGEPRSASGPQPGGVKENRYS